MAKFKVSKYGQWKYPGQPTAVPTEDGRITMQGVPYPVMGYVPGQPPIIMQPGGNYQFPGKMVYEIPMAQYGKQIKESIVSAEELPEDSFPYEGTSALFKDERYNINRAKELYNEDEFGHLPSIDYETGEWLKAKRYPTSWKEFLQYSLNPEVNKLGFPIENKEGFLRYPNYANGGDISIPDLSRPNWLDKAQKGQQVKYYDDPLEFKKANQSYNKVYQEYLQNANAWNSLPDRYRKSTYDAAVALARENEKAYGWEREDYPWVTKEAKKIKAIDLPIKPVYKEKPKVEPTPYREARLEMPNTGLMPMTYMPPSNTAAVLSKIKEEDIYKQAPKVVPAPNFRYGGWLDKYQEGTQVKANLPGYNPEIGPTVKNAQLLQEQKLQEAVRNSRQLPSGAIQSTLGPIDYALLGSAKPVVELMQYRPDNKDTELAEIRKALRRGTEQIINSTKPKPQPNSTANAPYLKKYPELDKQEQMYLMDELSGRWGNEANYWRGYNKRMHGLDYDRPIPKFFDPTIPVKKQGGWLDNY
jgi:hypothetical protein